MTEHAVMQHMNRMHLANVSTIAHAFFAENLSWLHMDTLPMYPRKLQTV